MKDPTTAAEWQEAVDVAKTCLLIDSARGYGLIEGGPEVNVERCLEMIQRGEAIGVTPSEIEVLMRRYVS